MVNISVDRQPNRYPTSRTDPPIEIDLFQNLMLTKDSGCNNLLFSPMIHLKHLTWIIMHTLQKLRSDFDSYVSQLQIMVIVDFTCGASLSSYSYKSCNLLGKYLSCVHNIWLQLAIPTHFGHIPFVVEIWSCQNPFLLPIQRQCRTRMWNMTLKNE